MAAIVYVLCALTSGLCALLLLREHRRTQSRLLLWSGLSFTAMAFSNALVVVDFIMLPLSDFSLPRGLLFFAATALLLYGLVLDTE